MSNWTVPRYSKSQVNRAGETLVRGPLMLAYDYEKVLEVVNNWRSSHSFPLNTFQVTLRQKARAVDSKALVAQRIKRLSSIEAKLRRFPTMTLSQMQDLGGCRAIVRTVRGVRRLVESYKEADFRHALHNIDDYITTPQPSGYRGVHLNYRYYSESRKFKPYNSLRIEIQLRSGAQHVWATAVETVGTFIAKQQLKSSQGEEDWLRFFALMGTAFASREKTAGVADTPKNDRELTSELREYDRRLNVAYKLSAYGSAMKFIEETRKDAHFFLLRLNASDKNVTAVGFKREESERANDAYLVAEKEISGQAGSEVVLVSVDKVAQLRRAYPNYFLDTTAFIRFLEETLA